MWIDTAITPGSDWRQDIAAAIETSIAVVFVVSPGAVTSRYCKEELYYASALGKPIFPVVHKDAFGDLKGGVQTILQRIQWISCIGDDFEAGYVKLAKQLRKLDVASLGLIKRGKSAEESKARRAAATWVTATDTVQGKSAAITHDAYVCYHASDSAFAGQVHAALCGHKLRSAVAKRTGTGTGTSANARVTTNTDGTIVSTGSGCAKHAPPGAQTSWGRPGTLAETVGRRNSREAVEFKTENAFELNAAALESAHAFCFVLSAASLADEMCGEEFHAAYELDKPLVIVTPGGKDEIPKNVRGSMSMMIEARSEDVVVFGGDTHPQAALSEAVGAVFHAVALSYTLHNDASRLALVPGVPSAVEAPVEAAQVEIALGGLSLGGSAPSTRHS